MLVLSISLSLLANEQSLSVCIKSQSGDLNVGSIEGNLVRLSVDLLLGHFLNVDAPAAAVNAGDFANTALVKSTCNLDYDALPHWNGTHVVFCF